VIQWLPTGGNTLTAQQLSAGVYTASVTDLLGCVTTVTADITQPDQLNIGVDSVRNVSCFGQNDGAVYVSGFGGTSPYTYTWSTGSNTNAATSLTVGTYTVQVADVNNCSFSITANISQPPVLTASAAITRSILCFGGFGDASVTIAGGTAPYSISWNSVPPQNGNVLNAVPAGSYTASITDRNGCMISDEVTFNQPSQIATAVSQLDTICANSSSLLVATAAGGVGSYLYTWAPDGSVTTGTLQFSVGNDVTYTVVAFDKNGCAGSDAVSTINVYNLLDGNVQLLGYTPICPGQASSLEAKVGGYPGPVTYKWSHNIAANPGPHVVQPKSKTIYSLTVTNACGQVVQKTTTVDIASPPEVHMIADSLSVCAPGSIQFREVGAAVNSADPVVEWLWDFGNGEISGEQEPDFYFPEPGTYTVHLTVTSGRGCVNTSTVPLQAMVHPKPVADFTLSSTTLQLPFDELKCTNLSVGATNFRWDFGDGKTSTLVNPSVRLEKVGTTVIQLIAISQFGCMDTAVKIINTYSDIRFPNAFTPDESGSSGGQYDVTSLTNNVFFPYTSGVSDYSLQIFNRWGELIFESTDLKIGWDGYYRGVLCQQGVYVWKASAKLGDGKNFSQAGTVTLLRKGEE
jgi:gliding motility-associated-like protein